MRRGSCCPEWTAILDEILRGPMGTAARLGALGLATGALGVIEALAQDRDLSELPTYYPGLGAAGRT